MQGAACDGPDLVPYVYEAVCQIPPGKVSTYGDIASALGDGVAARAVGEVLSRFPGPPGAPKHRVVHSTGRIGKGGNVAAVRMLASEGVEIAGDLVRDMPSRRFTDLHVCPILRSLRAEQDSVKERVVDRDDFGELRYVAGLDVSYSGHRAFGAIAVYDARTGEAVGERTVECEVRFPYIPTYLSFRELPVLRPLVTERTGTIYLIDGHGALHPRGAGIASHIGVSMDVPTIGAAKTALVGCVLEPADGRAPVVLHDEVKGYRLGDGRRTTYVSVGHRVSLATAAEVCERLLVRGIPLPLRRAHDLAGLTRRSAA
jgi:deoxyribonuclease V